MKLKRAAIAVAATVSALAGVIIIAPGVAAAHHPVPTGVATCVPTGGWKVTWTATSDSPTRGKLWKISASTPATTWSAPAGTTPDAQGYINESKAWTATTTYAFATTSSGTMRVDALWKTGETDNRTAASITRPTGCVDITEPVAPTASYDCVNKTIKVIGAVDTTKIDYTTTTITAPTGEGSPWSIKITAAPKAGYVFPAGTVTEWKFSGVVNCLDETTPVAPTASYDCISKTIKVIGAVDTAKIDYTTTILVPPAGEGSPWSIKITAAPKTGYEFPAGTVKEWNFSGTVDCLVETTPTTPSASYDCVEEEIVTTPGANADKITYTVEVVQAPAGEDSEWEIKITATPKAGYEFPAGVVKEWTFSGTVDCEENTISVDLLEPVCVSDVPYIDWKASLAGFNPDLNTNKITITMFANPTGEPSDPTDPASYTEEVYSEEVSVLEGQIIYPGASESGGVATDWPGWKQDPADSGNWVIDLTDQYYRTGILVRFEINPMTEAIVSYPQATPDCVNPPVTPPPPTIECVDGELTVLGIEGTEQYSYTVEGLEEATEGQPYEIVVTAVAGPEDHFAEDAVTEWTFEGTYDCSENTIKLTLLEPECVDDVPYISWTALLGGFTPDLNSQKITVEFYGNPSGTDAKNPAKYTKLIKKFTTSSLTGSALYPGATEKDGVGTDWPGWKESPAGSGIWVEDSSDAYLRTGILVKLSINPTTSGIVSYPLATPDCANPPVIPPAPNAQCVGQVFKVLGITSTDQYVFVVTGLDTVKENTAYKIVVTAKPGEGFHFADDAKTTWTLTGSVDCVEEQQLPPPDPQVPVTPPPAALPETGSNVDQVLQLGALAAAAGLAMLIVSRKRRAADQAA